MLTFAILLLQDYPKLSQSYYSLLEVLTQDHMNFIASLEPHVIMYILSSISEGLTALGKYLCWFICLCHPQKGRVWPSVQRIMLWRVSLPTEYLIHGYISSSIYLVIPS